MGAIVAPLQIVCAALVTLMTGAANKVRITVLGTPTQPLTVGVAVIVATMSEPVLLAPPLYAIFPVPEVPKPISDVLVQFTVTPPTGVVGQLMANPVEPGQKLEEGGTAPMEGVALTVTEIGTAVETHPVELRVTVSVPE